MNLKHFFIPHGISNWTIDQPFAFSVATHLVIALRQKETCECSFTYSHNWSEEQFRQFKLKSVHLEVNDKIVFESDFDTENEGLFLVPIYFKKLDHLHLNKLRLQFHTSLENPLELLMFHCLDCID